VLPFDGLSAWDDAHHWPCCSSSFSISTWCMIVDLPKVRTLYNRVKCEQYEVHCYGPRHSSACQARCHLEPWAKGQGSMKESPHWSHHTRLQEDAAASKHQNNLHDTFPNRASLHNARVVAQSEKPFGPARIQESAAAQLGASPRVCSSQAHRCTCAELSIGGLGHRREGEGRRLATHTPRSKFLPRARSSHICRVAAALHSQLELRCEGAWW